MLNWHQGEPIYEKERDRINSKYCDDGRER